MELKQKINLQYFAEDTAAAEADANTVTGAEDVQDAAEHTGEAYENNSEENTQVAAEEKPNYAEQIAALSDDEKISLIDELNKSDPAIKKHNKSVFSTALKKRTSNLQQETQNEISKYKNLVNGLSVIYGTSDIEALTKAVLSDDNLYETESFRRGLTVEQTRAQRQIDLQSQALSEIDAQTAEQQEVNNKLNAWRSEAETLKENYPNFDFNEEFGDPETGEDFYLMISSGVPMETAYQIIHQDEIINRRVSAAVEEAKKQTVNNIKARGTRPNENGNSSVAASASYIDVNNMSYKDIDDIIKRVAKGEKITL